MEDETKMGIVPVKADGADLTHELDYPGEDGTIGIYGVSGKPLVETSTYRLAVAKYPTGQLGLVMVALKPEYNYLVDKQTNILATLQQIAAEQDSKYEIKPHYGAFFPSLVETMETDDAPSRKGVFMGYDPAVISYKQLVPLSVALQDQRVDLQTAVWMLGKYLKILEYVHSIGFAVNFVDETNWLIEKDLHGVFILNWMDTIEENAKPDDFAADIMSAAKIVWQAVGGKDDQDPPYDEGIMSKEGYDEFVSFLKRIMTGEIKSAGEEMTALYEMADRIWERVPDVGGYNPDGKKRPFHTWVTYPNS